ncbi:MAG TPA: biopolymer transporter ExbD [Steroidobacteraceae bacterium]|nr:biopolymer transporter ExbD [Steroidobacteraceae bacterium]
MRLQARQLEDPELNLTSLIDVVLLIVIFFMVSTTFVQEARLQVELPEAGSAAVERTASALVITITARGSYRVNEQVLVNNQRDTLATALMQLAGGSTEQPVTIRADARASHQSVVTAMDVAARLGFSQVNIATVNEQAED